MIDPKMEQVVERMFERCYDDMQFKQVIGVALESRRIDKVKEAIEKAAREDSMEDILGYTFSITLNTVRSNKRFRTEILR